MKHFIVTRFNDYFPCIKNPHLGIDGTWLKKRLKIFQTVTIPSLKKQTDQDFIWILKCHSETPLWARKILDQENLVTCYEKYRFNTIELQNYISFSRIIRKITNDKSIITTRLDTDDALAKDYIKIVKEESRPGMFFDFRKGIVKSQGNFFLHHKNGTSQFCSYMEYPNDLLTVYYKIHINIHEEECIKNETYLGWMQTHHDDNITPDLKTTKVYPNKATSKDLPLLQANFPSVFPKIY